MSRRHVLARIDKIVIEKMQAYISWTFTVESLLLQGPPGERGPVGERGTKGESGLEVSATFNRSMLS